MSTRKRGILGFSLVQTTGGCAHPVFGFMIRAMVKHVERPSTPMHRAVVEALLSARGHWPSIADDTGISRRTIEKIARREIVYPGVHHVETLHAYFVRRGEAHSKAPA